jgi:hypothetical protein
MRLLLLLLPQASSSRMLSAQMSLLMWLTATQPVTAAATLPLQYPSKHSAWR